MGCLGSSDLGSSRIIIGMDSQSPPSQPMSAEKFLRTVLRSRLLTRNELQDALRDVPRHQRDHADALAEHLIRAGKLSRYQARKLLKGVALGLVLGPFQVLAPVGKGGMGKVFLARDARDGRLIALKVLSRDDVERPQDLVDLRSLLRVASPEELARARQAVELIASRGYGRGRDLASDFEALLSREP